jgi:hypothetical protein
MEDSALARLADVDTISSGLQVSEIEGRPRPGANQTGAGSPVTQQEVRGDASSMPDDAGQRPAGRAGHRAAGGGS